MQLVLPESLRWFIEKMATNALSGTLLIFCCATTRNAGFAGKRENKYSARNGLSILLPQNTDRKLSKAQ